MPYSAWQYMKLPVRVERVFIDQRLQRFRLGLLIPLSIVLAGLITAAAVSAFTDGSMRNLYFLPMLCVLGTWSSVYFTLVRRRVTVGFVLLVSSVLVILVLFPFLSPEPMQLYVKFGALTYSAFVLLIVLSGVFGVSSLALVSTGLFYLQYALVYILFQDNPTWRVFLNSNFAVPLLSVVIIGYIAVHHRALVESMIRNLFRMQDENRELAALSSTDSLTGLYNRRVADSITENECARVTRYGGDLSCLMIDADRFKQVNDAHGHHAGDDVLRGIAEILKAGSRQSDVCARYRGEKFMILTPNDSASATTLAERIREEVEAASFTASGDPVSVTVSIGVSGLRGPDDRATEMVRRAEVALDRAKQGGRNLVEADEEQG